MTEISIPTAVQNIVTAARVAMDLGGMESIEALDHSAHIARQIGRDARARVGRWARETDTETIEAHCFQGSVAADILDGTVERPSVGNVRSYALQLLTN